MREMTLTLMLRESVDSNNLNGTPPAEEHPHFRPPWGFVRELLFRRPFGW